MFYKITFIVLGIASLIGWNAVLSSFDFFNEKYGPRVFNGFTLPLQLGNCMWGLIMPYLAKHFSLRVRITGGMICLSILLLTMPIIASFYDTCNDPVHGCNDGGYYATLVITYFIGSFNSIAQCSMIALAAQEGGELNMLFWVATGLSGLTMAVLDLILSFAFDKVKNGELISTIFFFAVAGIISVAAIILSIQYVKRRADEQEQKLIQEMDDDEEFVQKNQSLTIDSNKSDNQILAVKEEEDQGFFDKIKIAISHARFIPIFIFIIYVTTFIVFPNMFMNAVPFFSTFLFKWGVKFLNLTYQIGDVAGKYLGGVQAFHKLPLQYSIVILRFAFIATGILQANQTGSFFSGNQWFPFINMFLMASTNGFTTGGLMALGPKSGKGNMKVIETIGFIGGFALTFGIAMGSALAIPFNKLLPNSAS